MFDFMRELRLEGSCLLVVEQLNRALHIIIINIIIVVVVIIIIVVVVVVVGV